MLTQLTIAKFSLTKVDLYNHSLDDKTFNLHAIGSRVVSVELPAFCVQCFQSNRKLQTSGTDLRR